ncbi:hypothetical protein NM09_07255 [Vibrio caribbeanicus]|uniref:Uncharacterized protein n=1 Tax=Vibrio caribbeanicus TaxID=701175 RepID=A0ACC4NY68_9VIBR|nr:hypothetical protein NM09_07255 [Vibrio caribbeanicus]
MFGAAPDKSSDIDTYEAVVYLNTHVMLLEAAYLVGNSIDRRDNWQLFIRMRIGLIVVIVSNKNGFITSL